MSDQNLSMLRSYYYIGLFNQAIQEAKSLLPKASDPLLKETITVLMCRAEIGLNPSPDSLKNVDNSAPLYLQALKQFSSYCSTSNQDVKDEAKETLIQWQQSNSSSQSLKLLLSAVHMEEKEYKEALALVWEEEKSLDLLAVQVQCYLQISRFDLATKSLQKMKEIDDDDTLTDLCSVWCGLAQGGERINEAVDTLQELNEKFGPSVPVNNLLGCSELLRKNYVAAFTFFKQAREQAAKQQIKTTPETFINTIICLLHLNKPKELINKVAGEFRSINYNGSAQPKLHPWFVQQQQMEEMFDRAAATYSK